MGNTFRAQCLRYSSMRYVAAYCLAALGGATPSAKDIEKILSSVGVDCDADLLARLYHNLMERTSKLSLLKVWRRLVPCQPLVVVEELPQLLLVVMLQLLLLRKRRKRNPKKSDDDMGFGLFD